jgi:UDP-N-acetyl-D-mannosaminuronic acid dehydrogenase
MSSRNGSAVVVGGCGHVGLPLAIALAQQGVPTVSYDIAVDTVEMVNQGEVPFFEPDTDRRLAEVLAAGTFEASSDPASIALAEYVVIVIGTPVDEHLNPSPQVVPQAIEQIADHLRDGQLLILRSTVYPGVTRLVERLIDRLGLRIDVAFCPERIAEGKAFTELFELPQVVSGCSQRSVDRVTELFLRLAPSVVEVTPEEAELVKLFTNTWRYLKFAAVNQFYMIANDAGVDFERVRQAIRFDYPRAADMPGPGFAAGPCLLKDTLQLAAVDSNSFMLGHAAMMVNEGLPAYVVSRMAQRHDLPSMTVGILGTAFKGESDDIRASLAYKLKRILRFRAADVLCTDPYVTTDPNLVPVEKVLEICDVLVIGAPHLLYRDLRVDVPIYDVWNLRGDGVLI